ncbi:MAG: hypothetical protein ABSG43_23400, partial [Solirubrobacteraceae bacterium]
TYVMLLAAVLTGDPADGAVVVCCYGTIRGLTPLIAARVRAPAQLLALHAALARVQVAVARAGLVALAVVFMVAVAGSVA